MVSVHGGSLSGGSLLEGSLSEGFLSGESLSGRVSIREGSLSRSDLCPEGLCPGGSLSRGGLSRRPPYSGRAGGTHPMADPGFLRGGGANSPGGVPIYDFAKISQKLHKIERIWTPGAPPLDLPLTSYWNAFLLMN